MNLKGFLIIVLLCLPVPAMAGAKFAHYEAKDSIFEGTGGTRETEHEVDYWVSGDPPRRFEVLGTITDSRKDKLLSGNAIGSKKIAKLVKENGGDAVILVGQNSRYAGNTSVANVFGSGNYGSVVSSGRAVHNITTTFVVIRYLDEQ